MSFGLLSYKGEDSMGGAGGSIDVGLPEFWRSSSIAASDSSSAAAISLVTALGLSICSSNELLRHGSMVPGALSTAKR